MAEGAVVADGVAVVACSTLWFVETSGVLFEMSGVLPVLPDVVLGP